MKAIPRWLVYTPTLTNGTHWHVLPSRKSQREFADKYHGDRYEVHRSKH
jgi:hypothetical protein